MGDGTKYERVASKARENWCNTGGRACKSCFHSCPLVVSYKKGKFHSLFFSQAVSILLHYGVDATLQNKAGQNALDVASPSIKALILQRPNVPLYEAVWKGDADRVEALLVSYS